MNTIATTDYLTFARQYVVSDVHFIVILFKKKHTQWIYESTTEGVHILRSIREF